MRFLFWPLLLLFSFNASAIDDPDAFHIEGNPEKGYYSIARHALILEDKEHAISIEQIMDSGEGNQNNFTTLKEDIPNLDFTTSGYWVKFRIKSDHNRIRDYLLEVARPLTNIADLYIVRNGVVKKVAHGDDLPFDNRVVNHRKLVFPVTFQPGEEISFYLNIASDGEVLTLPIKLWHPGAWSDHNYLEQYVLGFYFGILLFVTIIYFFFYVALKDKSFLYYVLYVAFLGLLQLSLDGLAYQYLWSGSPWLGNHAVLLSACLSVFFLIAYARCYLDMKQQIPKMDIVFKALTALVVICFVLSFTSGTTYAMVYPSINAISLIATLAILGVIIRLSLKGCKVNLFFSLAFVSLIAGAVIFILGNFNVLPNNMFTEHSLKFGSALEVVFLSLTMAGKYRDIQQEKEQAQQMALEKLEEMNRMKDEINVELEKQVKERTREINNQKEELAEKNKDITDSINYAKRIQEAILPHDEERKRLLPNSFLLFKPKDIVSGDFYWITEKDDSIFFIAADCTGHGVPGAFMSMIGNSLLNETVNEKGITEPGEILNEVRSGVINALNQKGGAGEQKDGMDAALCKLSTSNEQWSLQYAGANNPLWIIRRKRSVSSSSAERLEGASARIENGASQEHELIEVKGDKQPVGLSGVELQPFTNHKIELQKGDTIYIFSDGYPDQFGGPKGKKFKYKAFKELLISIHDKSMEEQQQIIDQVFEEWKGDLEQVDDVCVIGVRV